MATKKTQIGAANSLRKEEERARVPRKATTNNRYCF